MNAPLDIVWVPHYTVRDVEALEERIWHLEVSLTLASATAELLRAQLKAERIEPIDEQVARDGH